MKLKNSVSKISENFKIDVVLKNEMISHKQLMQSTTAFPCYTKNMNESNYI